MNGVLVILEHAGGWHRLSWEALAAGQEVAGGLGLPLLAAVPGASLDSACRDLAGRKVDGAFLVRHELLDAYTADGYTEALAQLIRRVDPAYVVFPNTYQVRDYAPKLATRFGQTMIADVIGLHVKEGRPTWVRQLMQGKLNADYVHEGEGPCFVSVQAGAFRADTLAAGSCSPEVFVPSLAPGQIRIKPGEPFRESADRVDLSAAPLIVAVGRGIKEKDNLPLVEELAEALGAEMAASRPIIDSGWLPAERQVGSSGQSVAPRVYFAVGISGAIQHLVGMKGSQAVVAINKDENAPIFEVADYGIVGDLFEVVPALTEAVRRAKQA